MKKSKKNRKRKGRYAGQNQKKTWNYFLDLLKMKRTIEAVEKVRSEWDIPKIGYASQRSNIRNIKPPTEWARSHSERELSELRKEIKKFTASHGLHCGMEPCPFETYIFYNSKIIPRNRLEAWSPAISLAAIPPNKADDQVYCIAIKLSPYVGKRDLLDYVKNAFTKEIEPFLKKKRDLSIKIRSTRTKRAKNEELIDFIYENREKPIAEISKLVTRKFPKAKIDQGGICSIKSKEIKKRDG